MRIIIVLGLSLTSLSPNSASAQQALIRARSGNAIYYARSFSYDNDTVSILECDKTSPNSLKRRDHVVLESDNICAYVNFDDQLQIIEKAIATANLYPGTLREIRIFVPQVDQSKRQRIEHLNAGNKMPLKVLPGGKFKIEVAEAMRSSSAARIAIGAVGNPDKASRNNFVEIIRARQENDGN